MRCPWPQNDALMTDYHDHEWGNPVHDDKKHFEMLLLESFQAGLTWKTILHRREGFRKAFADFEVNSVSQFSIHDIERLTLDVGIIRHRLKIEAAIGNAKAFIAIQKEFGSFNQYIWQFTGGKPIVNQFTNHSEIPAQTAISNQLSKDLKKRGFKFMGSTICYAYMQAAGLVNDYLVSCQFRK
jgi:DNA-3-methyladenine glycosylase I